MSESDTEGDELRDDKWVDSGVAELEGRARRWFPRQGRMEGVAILSFST